MKNIFLKIIGGTVVVICVLLFSCTHSSAATCSDIKLVVNGVDITEQSCPVLENDRTLVPIRFIAEALGQSVTWDGEERSVTIVKDNKNILLYIDSYLVTYNNGDDQIISDVAIQIINSRTYVPARLISNIFGIGVEWDNATRTVYIESSKQSQVTPFFDVSFDSIHTGDTITGEMDIEVTIGKELKDSVDEVRLVLLNQGEKEGAIVAVKNDVNSKLHYIPRIEDSGTKVLVAALYDKYGKFVGGKAISVTIDIIPIVQLSGVDVTKTITGPITLTPSVNFLASQVTYEIANYDNGTTIVVKDGDPQGSYLFTPTMELNGDCAIKAIAYDENGNAYESEIIYVTVLVERVFALKGFTEGKIVSSEITLSVSRNFNIRSTEFVVAYKNTGEKNILPSENSYSYAWFPTPAEKGDIEVYAIVIDLNGVVFESEHINGAIDMLPILYLQGIGPQQVITKDSEISYKSNVDLTNVTYTVTNATTNNKRSIGESLTKNEAIIYHPIAADEGEITIQVKGMYQGYIIESEAIPLTIYLKTIYGSKAIIAKDKFLQFASSLAVTSFEESGMAASLQVAQAILETGWGQGVPVDKYSGKLSNNLFGIKGSGSNGFVVANTWEVYNGVVYRIDDQFRAYNDVYESWVDHQYFLLHSARYEPFTKVMYDSTLGAFAIKRAGYATDPQYPIKLITIIKSYQLRDLDRVGIH